MSEENERALKKDLLDSYLQRNLQLMRELDKIPIPQLIENLHDGMRYTLGNTAKKKIMDNPQCHVFIKQYPNDVPLGGSESLAQRNEIISAAVEDLSHGDRQMLERGL